MHPLSSRYLPDLDSEVVMLAILGAKVWMCITVDFAIRVRNALKAPGWGLAILLCQQKYFYFSFAERMRCVFQQEAAACSSGS